MTVTSNDSVASFEYGSAAVYVTVVVPILNESPGLWVDVRDATVPELSIAVGGVQDTVAVFEVGAVF